MVSRLPKQPVIYEINTATFLSGLSSKYNRSITLGSVPDEEWQAIAALPVDAVWLMGVWERSPYSRKDSMHNLELKKTLPDFTEKDNLGSAYSIKSYDVDQHFGGNQGLATARVGLRKNGLGLILDYVPNHIACDHEWVEKHPEYLVRGQEGDLKQFPSEYYRSKHGIFAKGRDPEYPAWSDVLQLNFFSLELRQAAAKTLSKIAGQCDGIRCDMAMLMTNSVFGATWTARYRRQGEVTPKTEYWSEVLSRVRKEHPECVFIAEVYWDRQRELLAQGFDYCYDKTLYDYLADGTSLQLFHHIHANADYQEHTLRFIENHDEPRAAKVFKGLKLEAAIFILATLPGATMYYQGQLDGNKIKIPVHLGRAPIEKANDSIRGIYTQIIHMVGTSNMRQGAWQLCRGNNGFFRSTYLVAWMWVKDATRFVCIVNYGATAAAGHFEIPPSTAARPTILLGEHKMSANGYSVHENQITIELLPWGYTLFRFDAQSS
jgi:glycosidase